MLWKLMEGEHEYGPISNIPSVGFGATAPLLVVELVELVGVEVVELDIDGVRGEPLSRVLVEPVIEVAVDDESCRGRC